MFFHPFYIKTQLSRKSGTVSHGRPVWGTFVCKNIVINNGEASYTPLSLLFFSSQPGILAFSFPKLPILFMPLLVTILEPCILPHQPLHLPTIEHSSLAISEAIGIL